MPVHDNTAYEYCSTANAQLHSNKKALSRQSFTMQHKLYKNMNVTKCPQSLISSRCGRCKKRKVYLVKFYILSIISRLIHIVLFIKFKVFARPGCHRGLNKVKSPYVPSCVTLWDYWLWTHNFEISVSKRAGRGVSIKTITKDIIWWCHKVVLDHGSFCFHC